MARYLVIGGGITGLTGALELATAGHTVDVVERSSVIGGEVLAYCCKATDSCARCGVCVAHRRLRDAVRHAGVRLHTGARLASSSVDRGSVAVQLVRRLPAIDYRLCVGCDRCLEACPAGAIARYARAELVQYRIDYDACLLHKGKGCTACLEACPTAAVTAGAAERHEALAARACLVATGHAPFSPTDKPRYGYGRTPAVLTGREAEEILSARATLGEGVRSVGFVQCVGSRDPAIGRSWCSAVCCAYALRLARVIKHRDPKVEVTVYAIDLQSFDKCFGAFRSEVESMGVKILRGLPFRVDELRGGRLKVSVEGEPTPSAHEHDRLVLSVGMGPAAEAAETATLLGLETDAGGFYRAAADNVLVAGTCSRPQTIPECLGEAGAMASRMMGIDGASGGGR